jgi:hypothetical protein
MIPESTFDIPTHVVSRHVEDDLILLDLESGIYFALDTVGARIWALVADGASLAAVRDTMLEEFNVEAETLERDIRALMSELAQRKLIEARES